MNEQARPIDALALLRARSEALERAAENALAQRQPSGEVMTYELDGWVVREHPGGHIERLCPAGQFRAEDFPHPGFTPPPARRP